MDEVAMLYIVMAAHQPQSDPVADRQHNDTNNANLEHLGVTPERPNDSMPSKAGQVLTPGHLAFLHRVTTQSWR
jgi:hypothetical protein